MRKALMSFAAVSALLSGAAVLQLKYSVQEHADRMEAIAAQIHKDREAIRVLETEWSYLTSPRALQEKSIAFLALMPPAPEQVIGSVTDIPLRQSDDAVDGGASVVREQTISEDSEKTAQQRGEQT